MQLIKQVRMPCNGLVDELEKRGIAFSRKDVTEETHIEYVASDGRKILAVIDEVLPIDCDAYTERVSYYEEGQV